MCDDDVEAPSVMLVDLINAAEPGGEPGRAVKNALHRGRRKLAEPQADDARSALSPPLDGFCPVRTNGRGLA
jgi:hypothetical protein